LQNRAADVLNDNFHTAFSGDFSDFGGPIGIGKVQDGFGAEFAGEIALGFG